MAKQSKASPIKAKNNSEHTAQHYGFNYVEIKEASKVTKGDRAEEEKVQVMKQFGKSNDLKREIPRSMNFYNKAVVASDKTPKSYTSFGLDVIGVDTALAEGMVIQTAMSILKSEGYKNLRVNINVIGDKDSVKKFEKELIAYYKQNLATIDKTDQKKLVAGSVLEMYSDSSDAYKELNENAPRPMFFLSEESQKHFKQVLEYLEECNIEYHIQDNLIGNKNYFSKVIFTISGRTTGQKEDTILARGGRYDELAGEITRKRKISAVGLSMDFKSKPGKPIDVRPDIVIHLIKIGFSAKLKSLEVLEALKQVGVPIKHSIDETKLSHQIELAINDKAQYSLIIGQREANMGKVLVRNMDTSAQDEVKIEDLAKYMKKLV